MINDQILSFQDLLKLVDSNSKYESSNTNSPVQSRPASPVTIANKLVSEKKVHKLKLIKTNIDLRRAIQKQEEESRTKNNLVSSMMSTYFKDEIDPVLNPDPKRYRPRLALLD